MRNGDLPSISASQVPRSRLRHNVEITNDVQSLLLVMLAVMVAKMIGDWCNVSLYSSLLKLKGIPYLDSEPLASHRKKRLNLELFFARDVMEPCVRVLHLRENIASLAQLLASTSRGGFPVVYKPKPDQAEVFLGTITSYFSRFGYATRDQERFQITVEKLPDPPQMTMLLNRYSTDPQYQQLFINLPLD
ncbi:unnamed protein product [Natator depressus]